MPTSCRTAMATIPIRLRAGNRKACIVRRPYFSLNCTPGRTATWRGIARDELAIYELHVGAFTPQGTWRRSFPAGPIALAGRNGD